MKKPLSVLTPSVLALSVFMLAALAAPAMAAPVHGSDGPPPKSESQQRADERKAKADEKAYNDALDRIPDAKKNNDPWSKMR